MNKLEILLKRIFYSSLGGIIANSASANISTVKPPELDESKKISYEMTSITKPKLVLKLVGESTWKFANHRSHRSHSSHRSHASHYSSRSSSGSSGRSSSGSSGSNNSNTNTQQSVLQPYSRSYELGSRILKVGMKGSDVTDLINILLKKQYLRLGEDATGTAQVSGEYLFDATIEDAVKRFQTDNGLTNDGIVNSTTVYYLKNN